MRDLKVSNSEAIDLATTDAGIRRVQSISELAGKFAELGMDSEKIHAVHFTVGAFRFPSAGRIGLQALANAFEDELITIFTRAETFGAVIKELRMSEQDFDRPTLHISECKDAKQGFKNLADWLIQSTAEQAS